LSLACSIKGEASGVGTYYPKMGLELAKSGTIDGTREMAIAACRAAIDK